MSPAVQAVVKSLRARMRAAETEIAATAEQAVCAMVAHNTKPDLIFSPNEHYLNSLIQQVVAADKNMSTDAAGARHIYHNVRAYIKVQRKFTP